MGRKLTLLLELLVLVYVAKSEERKCPQYQRWNDNYLPFCEATCENPEPKYPDCVVDPEPGCECVEETVRTSWRACVPYGECILNEECKQLEHEEVTGNYAPHCEPTCEKPDVGFCYYVSHKYGCKCKEGYFRSKELGNKCVSWEVCELLANNSLGS